MIILILLIIDLLITISLIGIANFLLKRKTKIVRKRVRRWIIGTAVVFFFPLVLYLFGLAIDNHDDVKKGSFLWYATMNNETITNFPVLEPVGKVRFNSIGGDSPSIGTGWGIEYESKADIKTISKRIIEYLQSEGYDIKPVDKTQFYWLGKNKKEETNELYSGSNQKGESLDLMIQRQGNESTQIECSIVY